VRFGRERFGWLGWCWGTEGWSICTEMGLTVVQGLVAGSLGGDDLVLERCVKVCMARRKKSFI
jgi:hypothetical protein